MNTIFWLPYTKVPGVGPGACGMEILAKDLPEHLKANQITADLNTGKAKWTLDGKAAPTTPAHGAFCQIEMKGVSLR